MPRRAEATDHYAGPSMSEAQLKARVVELAHAAGWRVFSLPMIRTLRPVRNGNDANGYPDLTLARHRQVLWLELKAEDGVVSAHQFYWHEALPNAHVIRPGHLQDGTVGRLLARGTLG